jgi:hypothetical protein
VAELGKDSEKLMEAVVKDLLAGYSTEIKKDYSCIK